MPLRLPMRLRGTDTVHLYKHSRLCTCGDKSSDKRCQGFARTRLMAVICSTVAAVRCGMVQQMLTVQHAVESGW